MKAANRDESGSTCLALALSSGKGEYFHFIIYLFIYGYKPSKLETSRKGNNALKKVGKT